jgi:hypothetical protein
MDGGRAPAPRRHDSANYRGARIEPATSTANQTVISLAAAAEHIMDNEATLAREALPPASLAALKRGVGIAGSAIVVHSMRSTTIFCPRQARTQYRLSLSGFSNGAEDRNGALPTA